MYSKSWFRESHSTTTQQAYAYNTFKNTLYYVLCCCRCLSTLCMLKLHGNVGSRNPIFEISPSIIITLSPRSLLSRAACSHVLHLYVLCLCAPCMLRCYTGIQQRFNGRKQRYYYYLTKTWKYALKWTLKRIETIFSCKSLGLARTTLTNNI